MDCGIHKMEIERWKIEEAIELHCNDDEHNGDAVIYAETDFESHEEMEAIVNEAIAGDGRLYALIDTITPDDGKVKIYWVDWDGEPIFISHIYKLIGR